MGLQSGVCLMGLQSGVWAGLTQRYTGTLHSQPAGDLWACRVVCLVSVTCKRVKVFRGKQMQCITCVYKSRGGKRIGEKSGNVYLKKKIRVKVRSGSGTNQPNVLDEEIGIEGWGWRADRREKRQVYLKKKIRVKVRSWLGTEQPNVLDEEIGIERGSVGGGGGGKEE